MFVLHQLLSPKIILLAVIAVFGGCTLYIQRRGKERYNLRRQLSDFSTLLSPYSVLVYLFSKVPNKPVLDTATFPELQILRDNWEIIRDEALSAYESGRIGGVSEQEDLAYNDFMKRGWKRFYLKWYGETPDSAKALCPKTLALLKDAPSVHAALFAMMEPKSKLGDHRDPFAGSLRYHLGLKTPNSDDCFLHLDGETYSWRDGKDILWDETFIHWAANKTNEIRIILFCDVERPVRTPFLRALNHFMAFHVMRTAAGRNAPTDKLGSLNRLARAVTAYQVFFRGIKSRNRRLYYVGKWTLYAALLYLLLIRPFL